MLYPWKQNKLFLCLTEFTKLEKQLKYANAKAIPYVAIIGPEEVESNSIKLKNMQTGEQKTILQNEIQSYFS